MLRRLNYDSNKDNGQRVDIPMVPLMIWIGVCSLETKSQLFHQVVNLYYL
jgi:hypothetical protein